MVLRELSALALSAIGTLAQAQAPDAAARSRDEPMATGMMKQGMMQGDVKKAAEENEIKMKPMLKREEKRMPAPQPKPVPAPLEKNDASKATDANTNAQP